MQLNDTTEQAKIPATYLIYARALSAWANSVGMTETQREIHLYVASMLATNDQCWIGVSGLARKIGKTPRGCQKAATTGSKFFTHDEYERNPKPDAKRLWRLVLPMPSMQELVPFLPPKKGEAAVIKSNCNSREECEHSSQVWGTNTVRRGYEQNSHESVSTVVNGTMKTHNTDVVKSAQGKRGLEPKQSPVETRAFAAASGLLKAMSTAILARHPNQKLYRSNDRDMLTALDIMSSNNASSSVDGWLTDWLDSLDDLEYRNAKTFSMSAFSMWLGDRSRKAHRDRHDKRGEAGHRSVSKDMSTDAPSSKTSRGASCEVSARNFVGDSLAELFSSDTSPEHIFRAVMMWGLTLSEHHLSSLVGAAAARSSINDCLLSKMATDYGRRDVADIVAVTLRWDIAIDAKPDVRLTSTWQTWLDEMLFISETATAFPPEPSDQQYVSNYLLGLSAMAA